MGFTLAHQSCCHFPKHPLSTLTLPSFLQWHPSNLLISKLSLDTSFVASYSTMHVLSQLNQHHAHAATLSKCAPTFSWNAPSMMHTNITCVLSHAHSLYSPLNPALKHSQSSSLNPMFSLRMSQAVLQTMVNLSLFLVHF